MQLKSAGKPVKVVALSIGGRTFGFADIATDCIKRSTLGSAASSPGGSPRPGPR
jgi:hypothetical protein